MTHVATITIDHTKVPGDLTDYVGLIVPDGSAGYSALYALCLEGGGDIRLFKSDDTTELAREIVSFSVSAETGEIHYRYTGTLSSSVDTDIHVYADGSSSDYAVGATYGRNAVWSDYEFVSHDGGGGDSTGNGNTGTSVGSPSIGGATGKVGSGTELNGSSQWFTYTGIPVTVPATVTSWQKSDTPNTLAGLYDGDPSENDWDFYLEAGGYYFFVKNTGGSSYRLDGTATVVADTWNHLATVFASGTTKLYENASLSDSASQTAKYGEITTIGDNGPTYSGREWNGTLDEIRVKNSESSANEITAGYNNQDSYSTFYSVAAVGGGSTPAQAARRGAVMMM